MDVVTLGAALNGSKKYTDTVAQSLMGGVRYRGEVDYYSDLPNNAEVGDAYTVKYSGTSGTDLDGTEYTWGLNHQTQQYSWIDFSKDSYTKTETNRLLEGKQPIINSQNKLSSDLVDDNNSTNKFVTAAEKAQIATNKRDIANAFDAIGSAESKIYDLADDLGGKQDTLIFDTTPTQGSTNPVTSGGVHTALAGKLDDKGDHTTINGIDVYVSTTQPTGTIAEGSVGIGW